MADPIGIEGVMDAANNANIKSVVDLLLLNAIANQKTQQDDANSHARIVNGIRESSFGQIVNKMNSLDIQEAAAASRLHRTPSGDAIGDVAAAAMLASKLLEKAS